MSYSFIPTRIFGISDMFFIGCGFSINLSSDQLLVPVDYCVFKARLKHLHDNDYNQSKPG